MIQYQRRHESESRVTPRRSGIQLQKPPKVHGQIVREEAEFRKLRKCQPYGIHDNLKFRKMKMTSMEVAKKRILNIGAFASYAVKDFPACFLGRLNYVDLVRIPAVNFVQRGRILVEANDALRKEYLYQYDLMIDQFMRQLPNILTLLTFLSERPNSERS